MRLVTYSTNDHEGRAGAVITRDGQDQLIDLATASGGRLPTDLLAIVQAGAGARGLIEEALSGGDPVPLTEVRLRAPLARPPKLLAVAANYQEHVLEGGLPAVDKSVIVPKLFLKPTTTIIGPDDVLRLPSLSDEVDWELELAVVIGRGGRNIAVADALAAVFGYTVINDVSARSMNWQLPDRRPNERDGFFDWLSGKWLDGFAPMGPWIVTADEIPDPGRLALTLDVNGQTRQQASTGDMIFDTAELISFASSIMTLEPGDVIATGTPAGVGAASGTFLRPGDVMRGHIAGIGTLTTPVDDVGQM